MGSDPGTIQRRSMNRVLVFVRAINLDKLLGVDE